MDREEGELSGDDDESPEVTINVNRSGPITHFKRRRSEGDSEFGDPRGNCSWQGDRRDEGGRNWFSWEIGNSRQGEAHQSGEVRNRATFLDYGNPQAMSTQRRVPEQRQLDQFGGTPTTSARPERNRPDRWQSQIGNPGVTRNTTMSAPTKMFKVEKFPKNVAPTEQLQEWTFWLANFEMATEKAGVVDQRARAIDLSLHIGEDMRRIIIGKGMLPSEREREPDFPFYTNLVSQLEAHFRSLTDESVDVTIFNSLTQGVKETALDYEFRVMQVAKRVKETNKPMIRTRYLTGMRDVELRERAFVDGIPLEEVVRMATRKEAIVAKRPEFSPWGSEPIAVSAVAQGDSSAARAPLRQTPKRAQRQGGFRRPRYSKPYDGTSKRCKDCGVVQHRGSQCPALHAECFDCGETGHFRHMCPKQIRTVVEDCEPNMQKVND